MRGAEGGHAAGRTQEREAEQGCGTSDGAGPGLACAPASRAAAGWTRVLIASDWHLSRVSPPQHGRLALAFLRRAARARDHVILNGDVFEGLFEPARRAEAAHPAVRTLVAAMACDGVLTRLAGNHDPDAGASHAHLTHPTVGRVLVAHGHLVDPLHGAAAGRFGEAVSRRFGHWWVVRGAAHAAEWLATRAAGSRIEQAFARRCRAAVHAAGCTLGVFGHVHRQHLRPGDAYANAGRLGLRQLEYLALDARGPSLHTLTLADLDAHEDAHATHGGLADA